MTTGPTPFGEPAQCFPAPRSSPSSQSSPAASSRLRAARWRSRQSPQNLTPSMMSRCTGSVAAAAASAAYMRLPAGSTDLLPMLRLAEVQVAAAAAWKEAGPVEGQVVALSPVCASLPTVHSSRIRTTKPLGVSSESSRHKSSPMVQAVRRRTWPQRWSRTQTTFCKRCTPFAFLSLFRSKSHHFQYMPLLATSFHFSPFAPAHA